MRVTSEFDDIDESGGAGGETEIESEDAMLANVESEARGAAALCLSCGHEVIGPFCSWCGQKDDDMRRSSFVLAREFMQDTFGFDSRMWRTLGALAAMPGVVPTRYAHGKRSRYTPPVRLFIVVSFLFFLTIALTKTLFVAIDVLPDDKAAWETVEKSLADSGVVTAEELAPACSGSIELRFFVKEDALSIDPAAIDACLTQLTDAAQQEIEIAGAAAVEDDPAAAAPITPDSEDLQALLERAFGGVAWAVSDPVAFNETFNRWLPRVMFLMTPVLALILTVFIRGRDALIFDHLVLSLYTHAAGFAIVGATLILAQLGAPLAANAASIAIAVYYVVALKSAYKRGWVKTLWTAAASSVLYLFILQGIVLAIISQIIWQAAA